MGYVGTISALRPPPAPPGGAPSLDARREAFRDRLRATFVEPYPGLDDEFNLDLSGVWSALLRAFSGGTDYPLEREWLGADSPAWPSPEGVWAVRGRRPAYPMLDRPGAPEAEAHIEDWALFNDGGDVARILAWLEAGPTERFVSYFRAQHEAYVDEMVAGGASADEVERYAGGGREAAPYLGHWDRLRDFYRRAFAEELWVRCYIGV